MNGLLSVNIRPTVKILSVLKHLNYKPWYALAEFVDNSLQSYVNGIAQGLEQNLVRVDITLPEGQGKGSSIRIRDTAFGIRIEDFERAMRPADVPPNATGLSEFGMGMKSAACWFCQKWTVRTSAIGEPVERRITFDIKEMLSNSRDVVAITEHPAQEADHFTDILLEDLLQTPYGRTVRKIKDHLASIYRVYLKSNQLALRVSGESLSYSQPEILVAPKFNSKGKPESKESTEWRKDIHFDFGEGQRVIGFAALRKTGSTQQAGFSLFRRNRLIQGGDEEGYRPHAIFGAPTTFTFQKLFGELHLEGFEVSHTKDGFKWENLEEELVDLLRDHIVAEPMNLIAQAQNYRVKTHPDQLGAVAVKALTSTAEALQSKETKEAIEDISNEQGPYQHSPLDKLATAADGANSWDREFTIETSGSIWRVKVVVLNDETVEKWVETAEPTSSTDDIGVRQLEVRVNAAHPFSLSFFGSKNENLEGYLRVAAGLALSHVLTRIIAGGKFIQTFMNNLNKLLGESLSGRED